MRRHAPAGVLAGIVVVVAAISALRGTTLRAQSPPPTPASTPPPRQPLPTVPPVPPQVPPFAVPGTTPPGLFVHLSLPGSVALPPFGRAVFTGPDRNVPPPSPSPGVPPVAPRFIPPVVVEVESFSDQPAAIAADEVGVTITAPPGFGITAASTTPNVAPCSLRDGGRNAVRCPVIPGRVPTRVQFATAPPGGPGEALLDHGEPRPCISAPGGPVAAPDEVRGCEPERRALWRGDPAAWARLGVTDPDAVFNETVALRVRAGDPVAISNVAGVLGTPYLKVTRVRFQGAEQVEVTNLGGGPQDLAGWTLRSPAQGAVYRLPGSVLLQPGQTCTLFTATGPPLLNPGGLCRAFTNRAWAGSPGGIGPDATDVWPDGGGDVVLFYDALDLPGDHTRYSADPADQPPPPNLRLVGTVQQVAAPGRATLPPFGSVRFSYFVPCPPVVPGQPVPSCGAGGLREVVVMSASRETAEVTYDPPAALTITVPAGLLVRDVGAERSECDVPTEPNVLVCRIPGYGNVGPFESPPLRFTTNAPPTAPGQPQ